MFFCFAVVRIIHKSNNKIYHTHSVSVVNQKLLLSKFQRGNKYVIYRPWLACVEKNFALGLECMDLSLQPQSVHLRPLDKIFLNTDGLPAGK